MFVPHHRLFYLPLKTVLPRVTQAARCSEHRALFTPRMIVTATLSLQYKKDVLYDLSRNMTSTPSLEWLGVGLVALLVTLVSLCFTEGNRGRRKTFNRVHRYVRPSPPFILPAAQRVPFRVTQAQRCSEHRALFTP